MKTLVERVEEFEDELQELFDRHGMTIDCHAEFISSLRDNKSGEVICALYGDCEPDYGQIGGEDELAGKG